MPFKQYFEEPSPKSGRWVSREIRRLNRFGTSTEFGTFNASILATKMGVSARQFQRLCRRVVRKSPKEWLHDKRMRFALALLKRGESVKLVAYQLGFATPTQLSTTFRRHFGRLASDVIGNNKSRARIAEL